MNRKQIFTNSRGYKASIVARTDERILYNAWTLDGEGNHHVLQSNGSVSPAFFDANWQTT